MSMTSRERSWLIGMIAGWIGVACLAYYSIIYLPQQCDCRSSDDSSPQSSSKATSSTDAPLASADEAPPPPASKPPEWRRLSNSTEKQDPPDEEKNYITEDDLSPPRLPENPANHVNPLLAINATKEEMAALQNIRVEYMDEMKKLIEQYEGKQLQEEIEALSQRYLPRFNEIFGEERLQILAEETKSFATAAGYGEVISDEALQKTDEIISNEQQ